MKEDKQKDAGSLKEKIEEVIDSILDKLDFGEEEDKDKDKEEN